MIVLLDKPEGWTPLEALVAARESDATLRGVPMVYAGRLDPMASGLLLVLAGEERHALPQHLLHDKTYEAEILFGVSSDTHDALGRLRPDVRALDAARCAEAVVGLVGAHELPLPAFSSYRVRGRALHAWALEGRLGEIAIPRRVMHVHAVGGVQALLRDRDALVGGALRRIAGVRGAFRQDLARADWVALPPGAPLASVRVTLEVASGTYVRALAHAVGEALGCGALLWGLRRTRVGPFCIEAATRPATRPGGASGEETAGV